VHSGYDGDMPRRVFQFDSPDHFVAGAVGEPGARTFYLQARQGERVVTVRLEKLQVAALAQRIEDVLAAVGDPMPDEQPDDDDQGLRLPFVDTFRVGPMALGWDATSAQIVIEAQPESEEDEFIELPDGAVEGPDVVRVRLVAGAARAFARRAATLVEAGRPACPFCGEPLEPSGHFCLRSGGALN
jgi:uncharacterized repeat protein (TIGR03847 family)